VSFPPRSACCFRFIARVSGEFFCGLLILTTSFCNHLSVTDGLIPSFNLQTTDFLARLFTFGKARAASSTAATKIWGHLTQCLTYERLASSELPCLLIKIWERRMSSGTVFKAKTLSADGLVSAKWKLIPGNFTAAIFLRVVFLESGSLRWVRSHPPSKMARTSQRTQFVYVCFSRISTLKGIPHFKVSEHSLHAN